MKTIPEVHLTPTELASRLKLAPYVSRSRPGGVGTLANWRVLGKGPKFVKLGKNKVLYPITEVEAWEFEHMKRSTVG